MQRCAHMLRSRRLRSQERPRHSADPHILLRGPPEATNTIAMRRASIRRPIRTQCKGDPQLRPARKGRGGIFGPETPESTASGCSHDQHPTQKRFAEAETPNPDEAQNLSQVVVLASIDLHSQHRRLVSARVSASVRKGVLGSCNRAASQAVGRAYRIVLQRSRPRRGEKEGSKGLPRQNISKGLYSLLPRHGVHRGRSDTRKACELRTHHL
jgi:hypothetical protein